jgi:hypothetical protein
MNRRHLTFEQLESREVMAVASFAFSVPPSVEVGQVFTVEITAQEHDPLIAGLAGVSLNLAWDPTVLREVSPNGPVVTADLPFFRQGEVDNELGRIENLSGYAFLSSNAGRAIGNLRPEVFAVLSFAAVGPGQTTLTMTQGRSRIATVPVSSLGLGHLEFKAATISVAQHGLSLAQHLSEAENVPMGPKCVDVVFSSWSTK